MRRYLVYWLFATMLVGAIACSKPTPTVDCTSEETLKRSMASMLSALDEEEAKDLLHAMNMIDMSTWRDDYPPETLFSRALSEGKVQSGAIEYMQPLQGMTARELLEYAATVPNWVSREEWEQLQKSLEELH